MKDFFTLRGSAKDRHLIIFDIDETLFKTTAKIGVVKGGKIVRRLTNQDFNTYELADGESFEFDEFRSAKKFAEESKPIRPMINRLKKLMRDNREARFVMITAREDFDNKETFLDTFKKAGIDMSKIFVHRAGNLKGFISTTPARKAHIIGSHLDSGAYDKVTIYDDATVNLKAFLAMKKSYPHIEFAAFLVTERGAIKKYR